MSESNCNAYRKQSIDPSVQKNRQLSPSSKPSSFSPPAQRLAHLEMAESPSPQLVDTIPLLEECLEEICDVDYLAIGFEGRDLGARTGSLALIQVYVRDSGVVWLLDVKTMGKEVLEHEHYGVSIKSVLEDSEVRKVSSAMAFKRLKWHRPPLSRSRLDVPKSN